MPACPSVRPSGRPSGRPSARSRSLRPFLPAHASALSPVALAAAGAWLAPPLPGSQPAAAGGSGDQTGDALFAGAPPLSVLSALHIRRSDAARARDAAAAAGAAADMAALALGASVSRSASVECLLFHRDSVESAVVSKHSIV